MNEKASTRLLPGMRVKFSGLFAMTQDELKTILRGANLGGANLGGADLGGADLGGAYLCGADLGGVYDVIALGQPNGWWAFAYLWDGGIVVRVGCRTRSLAEGRAYWAGKEDRREVLAALDYAETVARLRGWGVQIMSDETPLATGGRG